jgi:flagellar basal body-associated protein FliL
MFPSIDPWSDFCITFIIVIIVIAVVVFLPSLPIMFYMTTLPGTGIPNFHSLKEECDTNQTKKKKVAIYTLKFNYFDKQLTAKQPDIYTYINHTKLLETHSFLAHES